MGLFDRLFGKKTQPAAKEWPADLMALNAAPDEATDSDDDDDGYVKDASEFLTDWGYPGYDFGHGRDNSRIFFIDGEDLADDGVDVQLRESLPFLKSHGVHTVTVDDIETKERYVVTVNERQVVIYDSPGSDSESGPPTDSPTWYEATAQTTRIINWLLESAGSPERAYITKPGTTDAELLYMTPDLFQRLSNEPQLAVDERPVDFGSLDSPSDGRSLSGWSTI